MSSQDNLAAFIKEDLLSFILKDDIPNLELSEVESGLMQDWGVLEGKGLEKEVEDFINSLLNPVADESGTLLDFLSASSDSSISEGQLPSCSPASNLASSPLSSCIVQADHNYSLHERWPVLESSMSDMAQGAASMNLESALEGTSKALEQEQSSSFPAAADAGPELMPEATMETEEQLLKKARKKIQNKQSASDSRRRRRMYIEDLENRLAASTAENQKLLKKVQLLQKQNMSLLKQLQKLRALVKQSRTRTTITTCGMVVVLSLCLVVPPNIYSPENRVAQLEITVQSQRIRKVPNEAAPEEGDDLKELSSQPEQPSTSGNSSPSQKEEQSAPNLDPRSSFNSNSSSGTPVAERSKLGTPQPQEQQVQNNPVQTMVSMMWKTGNEEEREHAATLVIEQHDANGM